MTTPDFREVDPRELRLSPSRPYGVDPAKLRQQLYEYGSNFDGMAPPIVAEDPNGVLLILNGTTRATRWAMFRKGQLIRVQVTEPCRGHCDKLKKLGEVVPK